MHVSGNMVWTPKCMRMWQADWHGESTDLNRGVAMTTSARSADVMKNRVVIDLKTKGYHHSIHHIKGKQAKIEWYNTRLSRPSMATIFWLFQLGQAALSGTKAGHGIPPAWFGLTQHCTITNRYRYYNKSIQVRMLRPEHIFLVTTSSRTVSIRHNYQQMVHRSASHWPLHLCRVQLLHS